jgi:hypothetical protein
MTIAVELDNESLARAIEIRNLGTKRLLPRELVWQVPEEFVPELLFSRRGIAAERLGSKS